MKYKIGDKLSAYKKTYLGSFYELLTSEGLEVGLDNILPVTGRIAAILDDHYQFKINSKFFNYFYFKNISMNESDFVVSDFLKDEDFMI